MTQPGIINKIFIQLNSSNTIINQQQATLNPLITKWYPMIFNTPTYKTWNELIPESLHRYSLGPPPFKCGVARAVKQIWLNKLRKGAEIASKFPITSRNKLKFHLPHFILTRKVSKQVLKIKLKCQYMSRIRTGDAPLAVK